MVSPTFAQRCLAWLQGVRRLRPDAAEMAIRAQWRTARRFCFASMLGSFPVVFIIDARWDAIFSPVIPGLIVLALVWIIGPPIIMEVWRRASVTPGHHARRALVSRISLASSITWLIMWLVRL